MPNVKHTVLGAGWDVLLESLLERARAERNRAHDHAASYEAYGDTEGDNYAAALKKRLKWGQALTMIEEFEGLVRELKGLPTSNTGGSEE